MTNKEYLTKSLSGLNLEEDSIDIILLEANLDPDAGVDVKACKTAVYTHFSVILQSTLQDVKEGDCSVSWNMEAVKMYYNAICNELGLENTLVEKPKIRNKSDMW